MRGLQLRHFGLGVVNIRLPFHRAAHRQNERGNARR